MAARADVSPERVGSAPAEFDAIHKLPRDWRYFNISVIWIFYYTIVIRVFRRLQIRHEVATGLSIVSGLIAACLIATAGSLHDFIIAALLVHFKDVFDATDGALARLTGTGHRLGRFLDTLGDGLVFTAWTAAIVWHIARQDLPWAEAAGWGLVAWLSLFLQCSYFNFHQLHYIRLSGRESLSRLDERKRFDLKGMKFTGRATRALERAYDLCFGWQDRLIARFDRSERARIGRSREAANPENDPWYGHRRFMVANSALCFGTHAAILVICLLLQRPNWFLPAIAVGMNLYWLGIVLARQVVFRTGR